MIDSLFLKGAPAFDPIDGVMIGPLTGVNFIFGQNGSGKTTISRAFADPDLFPGTSLSWAIAGGKPAVKVYNRDYVASTLRQAANLPGVFLLGTTSAAIQSEIDELTGPSGTIARQKKLLGDMNGSLDKCQADIAATRETLKAAAWAGRANVPAELQEMFLGFNNNKENFLNRLLDVSRANHSSGEDFSDLIDESTAVLAVNATELPGLPPARAIRFEELPGFELFAAPVVGSGDVRIAPIIQQLRNADWVQHGRHFLDESIDVCPFCQQHLPIDLAEQLDAYFDTRYIQQIDRLKAFQKQFQSWALGCSAHFEEIAKSASAADHLNTERFTASRLKLEKTIERIQSTIAAKIAGPSTVVAIEAPSKDVHEINHLIDQANASVAAFNLRLRNRASAKKALLNRCWVVFARNTLAIQVGRFEGAMPSLTKSKDGLVIAIGKGSDALKLKQDRLNDLQRQVTSSKPIIDTINRLLDLVGFHSFRLKESRELKDGYSLVRENGDIAADSLSEGERTFITFLYFAQSLQGTPQGGDESSDIVAVLDDPISSLDSDVLYAVSTLIRRIMADISGGHGRVRQLILLTHNAHFHKEVSYKAPGDSTTGWQFGIVRKSPGSHSEIVFTQKNPIQTAYGALWDEVKRASTDATTSPVSLQNILRRILETYFKVLGGIDNPSIIAKFAGDDQIVCRALFSWVNAGSHAIFDDLNYTSSNATLEANLRVFRQIFDEQQQGGHYQMMMRQL